MKVAFWENLRREEYGKADDLAAISVMLSINYNRKIILLDNWQDSDSFERIFRGIRRFYYVKEDSNYYFHRNGMDQILDHLHQATELQPLLIESAVEVIKNYLYYVPQSRVMNHLAYEYELYHEMSTIAKSYDQICDFVMIKTKNGNNLSTQRVLDEADLVVVELVQNYHVLDEFFDNYSSIRHKAIFLFSHYRIHSISINNIMYKYHLKKEQVIVLTEHQPMNAACLGGNLVGFLKANNNCKKESEHYRCIRELRRAAKLVMNMERSPLLEKIT